MKDVFAKSLNYMSYDTLKFDSTLILRRNDHYYYIVKTENDFIVWIDTPLYCRNIAALKSFEEARDYISGVQKHHQMLRNLFHHMIA